MIRTSRKEDISEIMDVWLTSNLSAHHFIAPEFWHSHFDEVEEAISEGVVVAEEKGEIVGFIGVINGFVAGLFVKEGVRGKGIGKALLDYEKKRNKKLILQVFDKNVEAIAFYEREGFIEKNKSYDEVFSEIVYTMEWIG